MTSDIMEMRKRQSYKKNALHSSMNSALGIVLVRERLLFSPEGNRKLGGGGLGDMKFLFVNMKGGHKFCCQNTGKNYIVS